MFNIYLMQAFRRFCPRLVTRSPLCTLARFSQFSRSMSSTSVAPSSTSSSASSSSSPSSSASDVVSVYKGKFLELVKKGKWEYVRRVKATGVVCIVPLTVNDEVVFIEQYRAPISRTVLELPAGLVGDEDSTETKLVAAQRETKEETGFEAKSLSDFQFLFDGPSSAGFARSRMSSEMITFILGQNLRQVTKSVGVGSEKITVHIIKRTEVKSFFARITSEKKNFVIDPRVYAGLYALNDFLSNKSTSSKS